MHIFIGFANAMCKHLCSQGTCSVLLWQL